jgi:hypothetical protein
VVPLLRLAGAIAEEVDPLLASLVHDPEGLASPHHLGPPLARRNHVVTDDAPRD